MDHPDNLSDQFIFRKPDESGTFAKPKVKNHLTEPTFPQIHIYFFDKHHTHQRILSHATHLFLEPVFVFS